MGLLDAILQIFGSLKESNTWADYGQFFNGVVGTTFAFASLIFFYATWRSTYNRSKEDSASDLVSNYCENHDAIINNMTYGDKTGSDVFSIALSEFYKALRTTQSEARLLGISLTEAEEINIAYHFVYYGVSNIVRRKLTKQPLDLIVKIHDALARGRHYSKPSKATSEPITRPGHDFRGNQNNLGHYFRNLYAAFNEIDRLKLSKAFRRQMAKRLRARLSNYEQAILCLNSASDLGKSWTTSDILIKYQLIKNIPNGFFSIRTELGIPLQKRLFPEIVYEWEENENCQINHSRPEDLSMEIMGYTITFKNTLSEHPWNNRMISIEFINRRHRQHIIQQSKTTERITII